MSAEVRIRDSCELPRINEVIHDYWFDLDDVTFDQANATLQIRFSRPQLGSRETGSGWSLVRRVDIPFMESFLRIHRVRSWVVDDSQQVGSYDFNELRFVESKMRILVKTGIPLQLYADVEALEVSVTVTESVLKTEKRVAFFA